VIAATRFRDMAISQADRLTLHDCYVTARQWFSALGSIGTSVALGETWRETPILVKEKEEGDRIAQLIQGFLAKQKNGKEKGSEKMANRFYEMTFTPSVKRAQERYGSRHNYVRLEDGESEFFGLTEAEVEFISQRDGFYMATVGENGYPYIQFRGGPKGFLKILDEKTLGFADFRGNLQYISVGNLQTNDRAALFLMDYSNRQRLKILARVQNKDARDAPELIERLAPQGYKARIERAMILRVEAFDWNCRQHITQRFTIEEIETINQPLYEHVKSLEAENQRLRGLLDRTR
jgi:uncharacterized protein